MKLRLKFKFKTLIYFMPLRRGNFQSDVLKSKFSSSGCARVNLSLSDAPSNGQIPGHARCTGELCGWEVGSEVGLGPLL